MAALKERPLTLEGQPLIKKTPLYFRVRREFTI